MHLNIQTLFSLSAAAASGTRASPTVQLENATVVGINDGANDQFLGIPFAQPPVGNLRLQKPQPVASYSGVVNATTFGTRCIQQTLLPPPLPSDAPPELKAFFESEPIGNSVPQGEDCLNINVIAPSGAKPGDKLPVVAWIYGGGFQVGSNSDYLGGVIVNRSIALDQPVIYVAMNYRVSAYGFLGGREVEEAGVGNLGLQDQREALRWVQKHITAFGGDPTKVTIWGESAGSCSVLQQMVTNDGDTEGLFRAAWMESGSVLATGDTSKQQATFDFIVFQTGCASANDLLACLREVPASELTAAMDNTATLYNIEALNIPYLPHTDGTFLKASSPQLVLEGSVADIPFVIGSCEDEGTIFSMSSLNLTTDAEFAAYAKSNYFQGASDSEIAVLQKHYPADPAAGSPFGTGQNFTFSPQYKRISAFQGDMFFQATRRFLLNHRAGKHQPAWSFLSQRNKIPGLGAAHSTDLINVFGGSDMTDFLVRFVNNLDPNDYSNATDDTVSWPKYTPEDPRLLAFQDGDSPLTIIPDTFREEAILFLEHLSFMYPM